jgi:hypothetical protein
LILNDKIFDSLL